MNNKRLNIAIDGLGNIGSYLFNYLIKNKKILTEKNNFIPIVTSVSAKNITKQRTIKVKKNQCLTTSLDATHIKDIDFIIYSI